MNTASTVTYCTRELPNAGMLVRSQTHDFASWARALTQTGPLFFPPAHPLAHIRAGAREHAHDSHSHANMRTIRTRHPGPEPGRSDQAGPTTLRSAASAAAQLREIWARITKSHHIRSQKRIAYRCSGAGLWWSKPVTDDGVSPTSCRALACSS
jgi:hypothetical protein